MYYTHKKIKTRKRHHCRVCYDLFDIGEECISYRGIEQGEGFYTIYFHYLCWEYSRDWDELMWETMCPGAISRKEILEETRTPSMALMCTS